jgi:hypothetical protein
MRDENTQRKLKWESANAVPNGCGYGPVFADETINAETDRFVTFISGQKVISGTTYNVLYGGISWGYTFTTVDIPEPATLVLMVPVTLFACARRRRRMA